MSSEQYDFEPMPETIAEIIGDKPMAPPAAAARFEPPRLEGTPPVPQPGIYFNMPDEVYFALPCLSTSGIKKLAASSMIFWASSWMNPKNARKEKAHFFVGKAYHCRLLEGASVFASRYVLEINRAEYPQALEGIPAIKDAIKKIPLPPELLGGKETHHKPITKVKEPDGQGGERERDARKEDLIKQLLQLQPDAPLWDNLVAKYEADNGGRMQISADLVEKIEISAKMIDLDPNITGVINGGHAEVVLIWYCSLTGVPMKAKVDKMKVKRMVDLKTFDNSQERSVERAIHQAISNNKYGLQPVVYAEGAAEVRKIVREQGINAVFLWSEDGVVDEEKESELRAWALKWASHMQPDEWSWVFQMKGEAPITRAVDYHFRSGTALIFAEVFKDMKRKFRACAEGFGADPWIDSAPRRMLADEDLSSYATEI